MGVTNVFQGIKYSSVLKRKFRSNEKAKSSLNYEDIFADQQKQKEITNLFSQLLKIRNSLVDENLCMVADPSTSDGVLGDSDNLPSSIVGRG